MSIAEKLVTIAENQEKVFDAGYEKGKAEGGGDGWYDTFWDNYQDNGNRTDYYFAFNSEGWNDITFKPKYDINIVTGQYIFRAAKISNIVKILADKNLILDTSKATALDNSFYGCTTSEIPYIDATACTNLANAFRQCGNLKKIHGLKVKSENTYNMTFQADYELIEIDITGTIGNNFDIHWSHKLNKASIISIINALSGTTSGTTLTLNKTAVNTAFGIDVDDSSTWVAGSEFYDLRHSKDNWTFSYLTV